jgi:hypothetical protein
MPTIIKSTLPLVLAGLLAGCAGGGGYYSSSDYGGGYGYEPYPPGGYYYAPSYYNFSYYGGGGGGDWRFRHDRDFGRSFTENREHWQRHDNGSNWQKKWWH